MLLDLEVNNINDLCRFNYDAPKTLLGTVTSLLSPRFNFASSSTTSITAFFKFSEIGIFQQKQSEPLPVHNECSRYTGSWDRKCYMSSQFAVYILTCDLLCLAENGTSCSNEPCQNGGTCRVLAGKASCQCPEQYYGKNCQNGTFSYLNAFNFADEKA